MKNRHLIWFRKSISVLPAINDLHDGEEQATPSKAIQMADTPEESRRHARSETPKRRFIAKPVFNNEATTKLT